jgi:hypothetical protein
VVVFSNTIQHIDSSKEKMQATVDELNRLTKTADEMYTSIRREYDTAQDKWFDDSLAQRNEVADLEEGLKLIKEREKGERFGLTARSENQLDVSIPFLIQTNVTRFGPMIIILFFSSIMVNLYRYNIRLSAYYDARADALILGGASARPEEFERYVLALSPDRLDIGKPPRLPTEYVVDLAKAAIGKGPKTD